MIPNLENLRILFKKMEENGFNTNGPLKWGFYFYDLNKKSLENIGKELEKEQYKVEDIIHVEEGDDEWRLLATKIEVLTLLELHARNISLNKLAQELSVALYDGWDVERV